MTAQASAALTIKVSVLGSEQVKALADQLKGLVGVAQRAAAGPGLGKLAEGLAKTGAGARAAGGQIRTLETELARLQRKADQESITRKAREILGGPPGTPPVIAKLRSVEHEFARLQRLAAQREITANAREALGMGPSVLTGHGFTNRTRQTIGFMRDLAVAGMGVRYTFQAAAAGVHAIVAPVAEFQQQLAEIKTKGGFDATAMAQIASTAKALGKTSQFGAREAASAGVELAAAGLEPGDIAKQLPNVLQFALAGGQDTAAASMTLVETMSQFGLSADAFQHIGDVMVKAANMSTIGVTDMAETFKYVGPIAKTAGIDLEQMSAMIALLGERGIKGSMAGTSLRQMIVGLTHPAKQAQNALKEIGLTKEDLQKGLTDLPAFLANLDARMKGKGMSQAQRLSVSKRLFGSEALATVETLMKAVTETTADGGTAWEKYRDGVKSADGALRTTADVMGNTLEGKIKRLKAATESAQIELGEKLTPVLTALIPKLSSAAVAVGEWIGNNESMVSSMAIAIPSIAGMTMATNGLFTAFGALAKVSSALGISSWGMSAGAAFGTSFIGAALPVIAAGIAGYGLGTMIAKAIGGEEVGAAIYEALHPEEAYKKANERGSGEVAAKQKELAQRKKDFEANMNDPLQQDRRRAEYGIDDPVLQGIRGDAPSAIARNPWSGLLKIEIDNKGQARVAGMESSGPGLAVGTNVGP